MSRFQEARRVTVWYWTVGSRQPDDFEELNCEANKYHERLYELPLIGGIGGIKFFTLQGVTLIPMTPAGHFLNPL